MLHLGIDQTIHKFSVNDTFLGFELIQLPVVYIHSHIKSTGAPHGETLGSINPLSNSSSNYTVYSHNFAGTIRYGAFDIGVVPDIKLMVKSARILSVD